MKMLSKWLGITSKELSKRADKYGGKRCVKARCFTKTDGVHLLCPQHTKEFKAADGFSDSPTNSSKASSEVSK